MRLLFGLLPKGREKKEGKMKTYHPPHIYIDNSIYFITATTIGKADVFNTDKKRALFFEVFAKSLEKFGYDAVGWVLNINHYYILVRAEGKTLGGFINNLHSNTARLVNMIDNAAGRKIWYQYWDRCVRGEEDLYARLNYIHHNPVKHGLALRMDEYKWSSYGHYLIEKGEGWLMDCFERYPIVDFSLKEGD